MQAVKDIEYRAILECETLGLGMIVPRVGPEILHGIEINPFAAELARTTIWIGDIQWRVKNAITHHPRPILRKLDAIECRDALLTAVGEGGLTEGQSTPSVMPVPGLDPIGAKLERSLNVTPAKAGVQRLSRTLAVESLDPRFRGDDKTKSPSRFVEAAWPEADCIVGNPPFLGGKLLRRGLGDENVEALFRVYEGRVPAEADLVCYWFAKAWQALQAGRAKRVGLVSTNSIRGGANRKVLEPIAEAKAIFEAWSDEAWTVDGAAVRVSLVCFQSGAVPHDSPHPEPPASAGESKDEGGPAALAPARHAPSPFETAAAPPPQGEGVLGLGAVEVRRLDGRPVARIHADLTAEISDLPTAHRLAENANVAFMGDTKGGAFDIEGSLARAWLAEPLNANGRPNSDVLAPWINGLDLTRRGRDMWIVDFGWTMSEREATLYEAPFSHAVEKVKPEREGNRRATYRDNWWRHVEPRPAMWTALRTESKTRYLVTPTVAKHRVFAWVETGVCPDHQLIAIARDDDTTFGILHSRFHEAWSLRLGTWLGVGNDPRYTPTTTFETFPFPAGLTPNIRRRRYAADPRAKESPPPRRPSTICGAPGSTRPIWSRSCPR